MRLKPLIHRHIVDPLASANGNRDGFEITAVHYFKGLFVLPLDLSNGSDNEERRGGFSHIIQLKMISKKMRLKPLIHRHIVDPLAEVIGNRDGFESAAVHYFKALMYCHWIYPTVQIMKKGGVASATF